MSSAPFGIVAWLTGRPGAGKSTIAAAAAAKLRAAGLDALWLDGARVRSVAAPELGFNQADCSAFDTRFVDLVRDATRRHDFVVVSAAAPTVAYRAWVRSILPHYVEVAVTASADVLALRDPKGLYAKVRAGVIDHVPGIDAPYDEPVTPELVLPTDCRSVDDLVTELVALLRSKAVRNGPAVGGGPHRTPTANRYPL